MFALYAPNFSQKSIMPYEEIQTDHLHQTQNEGLSNPGDFDSVQAAILQDLERNVAPEDAQMYGYSEAGLNGVHLHSYGGGSPNRLLHGQNDIDLDDPAALLESLANFEHPQSTCNVPISNDHFASLLQAAATAGQDVGRINSGQTCEQSAAEEHLGTYQSAPGSSGNHLDVEGPQSFTARGSKRKRTPSDIDEAEQCSEIDDAEQRSEVDEEQLVRERELWGPEEADTSSLSFQYDDPPIGVSDAKNAGAYPATALFRRPSATSKKSTRPPMSKLFTSLQVSPEQFLKLQVAAKAYMLDRDYPERRDCIGNRGRGGSDMAKLKLFEYVRSFLEGEGWGERCWGGELEEGDIRRLRWPQMKNKIISVVTPLLRRMVTNEKQRQYAVVTRTKASERKAANQRAVRAAVSSQPGESPCRFPHLSSDDILPQCPDIDPKLEEHRQNVSLRPDPVAEQQTAYGDGAETAQMNGPTKDMRTLPEAPAEEIDVRYHVNVLHSGRRIRPRLSLTSTECADFASLMRHLHSLLGGNGAELDYVQVLCPTGLVEVSDDATWVQATTTAAETVWMDGVVTVVAEVGLLPHHATDGKLPQEGGQRI